MTILAFKGSSWTSSAFNSLNALSAAQAIQAVRVGLAPTGVQAIRGSMRSDFHAIQGLRNAISDEFSGAQAVNQTIDEEAWYSGVQNIPGKIGDPSANIVATTYEIYLDNQPITGRITAAKVSVDEGQVFDNIEMSSIDANLFTMSDPLTNSGTARIRVVVGGRTLYFLLEDRKGDELQFSLWGRSSAARDSFPHRNSVSVLLTSPTFASAVASSVLAYSPLSWNAHDWILPTGWEYQGDAVGCLQALAQHIGAVVRSTDAGGFDVRSRFPVRPYRFPSSTPVEDYSREDNIIAIRYAEDKGTGEGAVDVFGYAPDVTTPIMEVLESGPVVGDTVNVRVFWAGYDPAPLDKYVTDGTIVEMSSGVNTYTEYVVFQNTVGSVAKPVSSFLSSVWIGDNAGTITHTENSKELGCVSDWGIAEVIYTSEYIQYQISESSVPILAAVVTYGESQDISVRVEIDGSGSDASPISDGALTSQQAATVRGLAYLDNHWYDKKVVDVEAPYSDEAVDGVLISIADGNVNVGGNFHIKSADIIFDGPKIVNMIEAVQCHI